MSHTMPLVACYMSGGPQDGARHLFGRLPLTFVDEAGGGTYQQTETRTMDGAVVFTYHAPGRR